MPPKDCGGPAAVTSSRHASRKCDNDHKNKCKIRQFQVEIVGGFGYNTLITNERKKMLDTQTWAKFPVTVDGVDFVSEIDPTGSFYPQIVTMPNEVFQMFHTQMIHDLIGDPSLMTREELEDELSVINAGATQALISLA